MEARNFELTNEGFAVIPHDTHIKKWVIENKKLDFDINAQPLINSYLKPGDVIIDAGANIGCYSYGFLSVIGETGSIYCFEPYKDAFECLEYNLDKFKNVFLYDKALGSKDGYVRIISENNNAGMNFCEEVKTSDVKCITIDSINLKKCDFIKIDVESFELEVLIGASQTIKRFTPILYIEINEHTLKRRGIKPKDIFKWLDSFGYNYKNIYPGQDLSGDQFDIICEF